MELVNIILCGYVLLGNLFLYLLIDRYATNTVTFAAKTLISFSIFCCFSVLVLLNIDVYQSLNNSFVFDLVNVWRFFYWTSFLFGYVVFVVLSEHDRIGSSSSLTSIWINFYRQRLPFFCSIIAFTILALFFMIQKNIIQMLAY
jgi:hypothetical protein